jgi:ribosomal protein S18 acetylase RimI-like enzyme
MDVTCRPITSHDLAMLQSVGGDRTDGLAGWLKQKAFAGLAAYHGYHDPDHEVMLGYVVGFSVDGESEIIDLVVRPDARRQGVALMLIDQFCHRFCDQMAYLEVARNNIAAYKLYRVAGFIEYGIRKAYYQTASSTDDAVLMHKTGSESRKQSEP